jgi:hypothetical protein
VFEYLRYSYAAYAQGPACGRPVYGAGTYSDAGWRDCLMLSVEAAFNRSLSIYRNGVRCAVLLCGAFVLVKMDWCLDGLKTSDWIHNGEKQLASNDNDGAWHGTAFDDDCVDLKEITALILLSDTNRHCEAIRYASRCNSIVFKFLRLSNST